MSAPIRSISRDPTTSRRIFTIVKIVSRLRSRRSKVSHSAALSDRDFSMELTSRGQIAREIIGRICHEDNEAMTTSDG